MRVGPVFSPRTMLVIVLSILFAGQTVNSAHGEVTYPTAGDPRWVAVADLNGDGHVDVATSNLGSVSVLLNRGDGKLLPHVDYAAPGHALIADINGDGSLDIVAAADSGVTALIGNGNGTFQAGILSRFNCGIDTVSLAVGDSTAIERSTWLFRTMGLVSLPFFSGTAAEAFNRHRAMLSR